LDTITKNKLYEGMFLVDSALAGSNWDGINDTIKTILEKAGAEIVTIKKWDDRKLAYEIKGKNRGTYILSYFRVDGQKIQDIEKAVKLSEQIMRVLILSAEKMTDEDIEKDTPALKTESETKEDYDRTESDEDDKQQDDIEEDTEQQDDIDEDTEQQDNIDEQTEQDKQEQEEVSEDENDSDIRD
jgi:small subunit ribosomal protein S6